MRKFYPNVPVRLALQLVHPDLGRKQERLHPERLAPHPVQQTLAHLDAPLLRAKHPKAAGARGNEKPLFLWWQSSIGLGGLKLCLTTANLTINHDMSNHS